jgi:gliding motility-associated-like protein
MKKFKLFSFVVLTILCSATVKGQLINDCIFLPGQYLEHGISDNGSLGSTETPPSIDTGGAYATRTSAYATDPESCSYFYGQALAESYDVQHDGWDVGSPYPFYGDYTLPGSPYEGWSIEINGEQSDGYYTGLACEYSDFRNRGSITLTGDVHSYMVYLPSTGYYYGDSLVGSGDSGSVSFSGYMPAVGCGSSDSIFIGTWLGTAVTSGGDVLQIRQDYRVDRYASWMVNTVTLTNLSTHTIPQVFYERSADPDNDEQTGGGFTTSNYIDFQDDAVHRVQVRATGQSHTDASMTYSAKDCRAKCFIFSSWPPSSILASEAWSGSSTSGSALTGYYYTQGEEESGDIGIGIAFNIGNIPPGKSASFSYSMNFDTTIYSVDSAFPDPLLCAGGIVDSAPSDVLNLVACDTLPVDLLNGHDKSWANSKWTWSPTTGLLHDTGVSNKIFPGEITTDSIIYHIHGVDSTSTSCVTYRNFTLIIHPCLGIWSNSPICLYDTLRLYSRGDTETAGVHYKWILPSGAVDTGTTAVVPHATWADTGYVLFVKYGTGGSDTLRTHITINTPPPTLYATANGPVCLGDSLKLEAGPYYFGETFVWSGPSGFTSRSEDTNIVNFTYADTGVYRVIGAIGSCVDTATVRVERHLPPALLAFNNGPACDSSPITLTATDTSAVATYVWSGPHSFTSTLQSPVLPHAVYVDSGWYKVKVTVEGCSSIDSTYLQIKPATKVTSSSFSNPTTCGGNQGQITLNGLSPDTTYNITYFYNGATQYITLVANSAGQLVIPRLTAGIYSTVTIVPHSLYGCEDTTGPFILSGPTAPLPPVAVNPSYCQYQPDTALSATGVNLLWYTSASGGVGSPTAPVPNDSVAGTFYYYVTQSDSGCESPRTAVKVTIDAQPAPPTIYPWLYCQYNGGTPVPPLTLDPSSICSSCAVTWLLPGDTTTTAPTPNDSVVGTYTYNLLQTTAGGCVGIVGSVSATVRALPASPAVTSAAPCQSSNNFYFDNLAKGDSLRWYSGPTGGIGDTAGPVQSELDSGVYVWYVTQTDSGCESWPRVPVSLDVIYIPEPSIYTPSPYVCLNGSLSLTAEGSIPTGSSFLWTVHNGYLDSGTMTYDQSIYAVYDTPGYTINQVTVNYMGCDSTVSDTIKVVPLPLAQFYVKPDICVFDTTTVALVSHTDNAYSYNWGTPQFDDAVVVAASENSGGPYSVSWQTPGLKYIVLTPTTEEGCVGPSVVDTVDVHVPPDAQFSINPDTNVCLEDTIVFSARTNDPGWKYQWSPAHFFVNQNSWVGYGRIEATGNVYLTVTNELGCVATDSIYLTPQPCCGVTFPNAFAPNGNAPQNRTFYPLTIGYHNVYDFRIANRWGETVYESRNERAGWDGTLNGVPQDMGVYYYFYKYDCGGKTITLTGDVTLLR